MHYLGIIICSILAYLIGSLSWSIIIVRWRKGIDIRTVGSGNAGATNTYRVLGAGWALAVVTLDALKVPFAALIAVLFSMIPNSLFSETSYLIPAVCVLVGHCWPVYYGFKGGKAVACFIGLLFIVNIWYLFIFLLVWWIMAAITRKVSASSIIAVAFVFILVWLPWLHGINTFAWHWNDANNFWVTGAPKWGWQNHWLRFNWLNYMHKLAFDFTVSHQLTLHHINIQAFQNQMLSAHPEMNGIYGMARWAHGDFNTVGQLYNGNKININFNIGYAEGMLEMAICMVVSICMILARHVPNMKRIYEHQEPETFPKMTPEEKEELHKLQHQPMPTMEERRRLKALEEKKKLEEKQKALQEKIDKINAEVARRDSKYAKSKEKSK